MTFDDVWNTEVQRVSGPVTTGTGLKNLVISVDDRGVIRRSSTGRRSRIPRDAFRFAVERLETVGTVSRDDIYEATRPRRVSSGVVAVLSATQRYGLTRDPVGLVRSRRD